MTGSNNHEWKKTTPQLQKMYLESGRFEVAITEAPDTLTYDDFKQFDAIVSNWTAWPEHEYRWPKSTEVGLMRYIEEGGGFVLFHAASATFYDWAQYHELIGSTWGDSTTHG
ncbi:MAG: ThuA domain-containing protein, partial [Cyclobacteriaceae bacterium]|nr:ThuA domain-containing protein [Cyclobacteriaceae bacterium]